MKPAPFLVLALSLRLAASDVTAESTVIAEDEASQNVYATSWDNNKNGGMGNSSFFNCGFTSSYLYGYEA